MDTVSMLNTMRFYCQPILPLVYDESMSYYETLCKVVGQLNTTGETVNKLNEGLTGEISDRQAADAALNARIKEIEETNRKIHFLKVDTLGHLLTQDVTREKLSKWIIDGDIISLLYAPDELDNSWAVAANYRSQGATAPDSMQLKFFVPISIKNNAGKSGEDIEQEIVEISLPVGALTNQWVVRSITSTIPRTNADGFVNLMATVSDAGAVTCDVEPGAIVEALRNYFRSTGQYPVAVNARLTYDGKQYHSASAAVKADASGTGNIRIAFENYWDGVRTENGVRQTTNETIFLVGDVKTNTWSVETIDHKTFDFSRYEGFQFTRGANNVITTDDESTPNAVYAQYHSDTSGKIYQNLPTRLIDTVDGAEYWNGTFDIYGGNHMSFTFVTSNYATSSDKMLVRVIELSADVGTTAWKYGVKEFTLPLTMGEATTYVDFWGTGDETYDSTLKAYTVPLASNSTFEAIYALIKGGTKVVARVYQDAEKTTLLGSSIGSNVSGSETLGDISFQFLRVGAKFLGFNSVADYISVSKLSSSTSMFLAIDSFVLPTPNSDGSDSGKVPTVDGTSWALKAPASGGSSFTDDGAGNISVDGAAAQSANRFLRSMTFPDLNFKYINPMDSGTYSDPYGIKVASGTSLIDTILAKTVPGVYTVYMNRNATDVPVSAAAASSSLRGLVILSQINKHYAIVMLVDQSSNYYIQYIQDDVGKGWKQMPIVDGATREMTQQTMSAAPAEDMQIATKKYVDDGLAEKLSTQGGEISASLEVGQTVSAGGAVSVGRTSADTGIHFEKAASDAGRISHGSDAMSGVAPIARLKVASPTEDDDATTKAYVDGRAVRYDEAQTLTEAQQIQACKNIGAVGNNSPQFKGYLSLAPANEALGLGVGLSPSRDGNNYALDISDVNEDTPTKLTGVKTPADADTNAAATVEYVLSKVGNGGAPITIKLGLNNAATSTATFAEIKAALEAGKAPVLESAPGTAYWFALNWLLTGSSSLNIQYGRFDIAGGGAANFNIYDVSVTSTGITYVLRTFSTE